MLVLRISESSTVCPVRDDRMRGGSSSRRESARTARRRPEGLGVGLGPDTGGGLLGSLRFRHGEVPCREHWCCWSPSVVSDVRTRVATVSPPDRPRPVSATATRPPSPSPRRVLQRSRVARTAAATLWAIPAALCVRPSGASSWATTPRSSARATLRARSIQGVMVGISKWIRYRVLVAHPQNDTRGCVKGPLTVEGPLGVSRPRRRADAT